jgi:hypothetical protein
MKMQTGIIGRITDRVINHNLPTPRGQWAMRQLLPREIRADVANPGALRAAGGHR